MLSRLVKISLNVTLVFLIIITAGVALAKMYEQEIKQYLVSYLNKYVTTEVEIDDIHLSFWRRFPQASVSFENTLIHDQNNPAENDTMLFAEDLVLEFNIWEVFSGNYTVQHIEATNTVLNLSVNANGQENYLIWKTSDAPQKEDFQFDLKEVVLNNARIRYQNAISNQDYAMHPSKAVLTGAFNEAQFDLGISSNMTIQHFRIKDLTYVKNEEVVLKTQLKVDKTSKKYHLKDGSLKVGGLPFLINGSYTQDPSFCDFHITGNQLVLHEVFSVFPAQFFDKFVSYKSDGNLSFEAWINGPISKFSPPHIASNFIVESGSLTEPQSGITLQPLQFEGYFNSHDNGTENLSIKNLSASLLHSQISGKINIRDFDDPTVELNLKGNADLASVHQFFNIGGINYLNGTVNFNANIRGKTREGAFRTSYSKGKFIAKNVNLQASSSPLEYTQINGVFQLNNGNAIIKNCTGNIYRSDVTLNGIIKNVVPYVFARQGLLMIEADLRSSRFDLKEIMKMATSVNQSRGYAPAPLFPPDLAFNLNTQIDELFYGKFDAIDLRGIAQLKNQLLTVKQMRFKANEGSFSASAELDGRTPNNYLFTSNARLKNIDLQNLLDEFDNFGQVFLQSHHIKGVTSANIRLATGLDNGFNIYKNSIRSSLKFKVRKGELIRLPALIDVADYLHQNKLIRPFVNTEKLSEQIEHITFSDLENEILIQNQKIIIPKMNIESSALDINIKGEHGFNDSIDYGLNFRLRDVLMKEDKDAAFGTILDDGTGYRLYLSMGGTVNHPVFSLDKEERKQARREKMIQEKETIKAVLKQELGLFKKDSSVKAVSVKKNTPVTFEVDFEQSEADSNSNEGSPLNLDRDKKEKNKKPPGKLKRAMLRLESEKNEEEKPTFELEIDEDL